jgi:hypothetical protein
MGKIGLGLLTYKRPEYYKKVLDKVPKNKVDYFLVVNDGEDSYVNKNDADFVIYNEKQLGVSESKNKIIDHFINNDIEHVFIMEDDVIIKNENVFTTYINTANVTGIHHLNFSKIAGNEKTLCYTYEHPTGYKLGFYQNPQAAFCYFNINLFKKLGKFDENFLNAFEHIDFEYRLVKNKVAPPFWYFPDVFDSENYLTTIDGSDESSTITNKENYETNLNISAQYFIKKHEHFTNQIPKIENKNLPIFLMNLDYYYNRKKIYNNKKLSVIIPYRNREKALKRLIPKLKTILDKQVQNYNINVIEQNDNEFFNKGLLLNIGILLNYDSDYYCIHDVDLIPEFADYSYPKNPSHLSKYCSQFNYIENKDALMGGVVTFKKEHIYDVNGYPNDYIGWGSEDNCLCNRFIKKDYQIYQYPFGRFYSVPHTPRISDPREYEMHIINGQKREDEKKGLINSELNGIKNIDLSEFTIDFLENNEYNHFKVKRK